MFRVPTPWRPLTGRTVTRMQSPIQKIVAGSLPMKSISPIDREITTYPVILPMTRAKTKNLTCFKKKRPPALGSSIHRSDTHASIMPRDWVWVSLTDCAGGNYKERCKSKRVIARDPLQNARDIAKSKKALTRLLVCESVELRETYKSPSQKNMNHV